MTTEITNEDKTLTVTHMKKIFGSVGEAWHPYVWSACQEFGITKKLRLAAFLANIKVESGGLTKTVENMNYSASRLQQVWPKRFPTNELAQQYANSPEKLANFVYGGRMGNNTSGDGWLYRGRGLIQVTGRSTYNEMNNAGIQCLGANAAYIEGKEGAARSAAWFFKSRGLNELADRNEFDMLSRRINTGGVDMGKRREGYKLAIIVLSDGAIPDDADLNTESKKNGGDVTPSKSGSIVEPTITEIADDDNNVSEPISGGKAEYPYNRVLESRSGHVIEIDDTPSAERLHYYHRSGTYWEMHPDGKYSTRATNNNYVFNDQHYYNITKGNHFTKTDGYMYHKVKGDAGIASDGIITLKSPVIQLRATEIKVPRGGTIYCENIVFSTATINREMFSDQQITPDNIDGNVQDMKTRAANVADFALRANIIGRQTQSIGNVEGNWNGRITDENGNVVENTTSTELLLTNGSVSFTAANVTDSTMGFKSDSDDGLQLQTTKDHTNNVMGNKSTVVNQDMVTSVGGDKTISVLGNTNIESGEALNLKGKSASLEGDRIDLKGSAGVYIDNPMLTPISSLSQLPAANSSNAGKVILYVMNNKLSAAMSTNNTWIPL